MARVYLLTEGDFQALLNGIQRDPDHGVTGSSSDHVTQMEREAHRRAHRFYNYQIHRWIEEVKK